MNYSTRLARIAPGLLPRSLHLADSLVPRLRACAADPLVNRGELAALNAELLTSHPRPLTRLLRTTQCDRAMSTRLLGHLIDDLGPDALARVLPFLPSLEPHARRAGQVLEAAPRSIGRGPLAPMPGTDAPGRSLPGPGVPDLVQGRLGDCWLIATMIALEATSPGHLESRITPVSADFVTVRLYSQAGRPRDITISTTLPGWGRCGGLNGDANTASLVEKACAVAFWGSYRHLRGNFAGTALRMLTGTLCPARPLPRSLGVIAQAMREQRPVLVSTLVRRRGSAVHEREDVRGHFAVMDGHVYAALSVRRCTEDGEPAPSQPLRVHLHNPLGGTELTGLRRTDLYLSASQLRTAFLSMNIGPSV